jgi:predicted CopG family antitoxin
VEAILLKQLKRKERSFQNLVENLKTQKKSSPKENYIRNTSKDNVAKNKKDF